MAAECEESQRRIRVQTVFKDVELQYADHTHDVGLGADVRLFVELHRTFL